MTRYGSRVLDQEEYIRQEITTHITSNNTYGERVTGVSQADLEAEIRAKTAAAYAAAAGADQPPVADVADAPAAVSVSVAEIERLLVEQIDLYDQLLQAELARPEGARQAAVELFIANAEAAGKDEAFVETLYALLS